MKRLLFVFLGILLFVVNSACSEVQNIIVNSNEQSEIHYVYDFPKSKINDDFSSLRFHQYLDLFSNRYYAELSIKYKEDIKKLTSFDLYKIEIMTGKDIKSKTKIYNIPIQGVYFRKDQGININFSYDIKEEEFDNSAIKFYFRIGKEGKSNLAEYVINFKELKKIK